MTGQTKGRIGRVESATPVLMKIPSFDRVRSASLLASAVALFCVIALGCSISYSSESASDSSENSSESSVHSSDSSRSSSPESEKKEESARFEDDVEQYTVAFLGAGGTDGGSFLSGLGDLARRHGISDWEQDAATWEAIGRGLARSEADQAERVAVLAAWTGGDAAKQSAAQKGLSAPQ